MVKYFLGTAWCIASFFIVSIALCQTAPDLDIKAGNSDDLLIVTSTDSFTITLSLNTNDTDVQNADWWVVAYTPAGWKSLVIDNEKLIWTEGIQRCIAMPLVDLALTQIPPPSLSKGDNYLYFAVDDNSDGIPDATWFDSVSIRIESDLNDPILYIGLMVHLEGYPLENKTVYDTYKSEILSLADIFDQYNAKLTLELKEPVKACDNRNDYYFKDIEDRGHAVGVHADAGGVPDEGDTWQNMSIFIKMMKEKLEKQGVSVRHVSGYCSPLDWVSAVVEAGYSFVTGGVTWCLMSLPEEDIPSEYLSCLSPADCHEPYPATLTKRLHPWTIKTGEPWTQNHDDGELVFIPSAIEGLPFMAEKAADPDYKGKPRFDSQDVDLYIEELETALKNLDPDQPNFAYAGWSFGTKMPDSFAHEWLSAIQPYIDAGRVQWKTIPQMYDIYVNWRNNAN